MARNYSNESLPQELWFKIFALLPVLSLLPCKSVCKKWLSILSDTDFIKTHFIESQKRLSLSFIKVVKHDQHYSQFYIDKNLLHSPNHLIGITCLISSCNGLVCLASRLCDVIVLWNPMTRQFKNLPTPKCIDSYPHLCYFKIGFGFDHVSQDYKILRIVTKYKNLVLSIRADIYSANEDSWREIEVPNILENFKFCRLQGVGIFLPRGVLYFEGFHGILSFDLHDQVFRMYPYPTPVTDKLRVSKLLDFEGSLAMAFDESINTYDSLLRFNESFRSPPTVLSLWTLDEDAGGNAFWTKQSNLENRLKHDHIALYLSDGQFLVADHDCYPSERITFYYYKKEHPKRFLQAPQHSKFISVFKYTESLVSLPGFKPLNRINVKPADEA